MIICNLSIMLQDILKDVNILSDQFQKKKKHFWKNLILLLQLGIKYEYSEFEAFSFDKFHNNNDTVQVVQFTQNKIILLNTFTIFKFHNRFVIKSQI